VKTGIRLAALTFAFTWIPLSLWRGLAMGRSLRIGNDAQQASGPLVDGVIQIAMVMLAPALFAAVFVFVLWSWREERNAALSSK
jgi:hypothetical protein